MALEKNIQNSIIKHAKKEGWITIKTIRLSESGFPDIFLFKKGQTIFIEVKNEKGIHSELQKVRQKQLRESGFISEVCRSLEDFKKVLNDILNK